MDYADASSLPERTNLYLNSVNRILSSDSPNNFEIIIGDSLVSAGPEEVFYINVIQFNTVNNFYQIQNGYNTDFQIILYNNSTTQQIITGTIPYGNLTAYDILSYLNTLLNGLVNVVYTKTTNTFTFTRIINTSTLYNNMYINNIYLKIINCDALLGFSRSARNINIEFVYNVGTTSTQPINVLSITNFYIHVSDDMYMNDDSLDNHNSSEVDTNQIIFAMPITVPFNNVISYMNIDGGNSFYYRLDNNKDRINTFRLQVRDQFNQLIPNFPDYNMCIQFTKKTRSNIFLQPIKDIRTYLNQIYLMLGLFFQKIGLII